MPLLMHGKKGLVTGVANNRSLAWGIAKNLADQGAEIAFSYDPRLEDKLKNKLTKLTKDIPNSIIIPLDGSNDESIENAAKEVENKFGKIDFLVHSMAFAKKQNLEGKFYNCTREDFALSLDISVYSFIAMAQKFAPILNEKSSLLTLSYLGAVQVMPNYNLMGIAKSALEASVRYLANDFGEHNIRVNAISAGPVKTLAGSGISSFNNILKFNAKSSPLRRTVTTDDVGKSGLYLLSDLSSGVTGEIHYVDNGFNTIAMPMDEV